MLTPSTATTTASAAVSDDSVDRNEDGEELEFVKMEGVRRGMFPRDGSTQWFQNSASSGKHDFLRMSLRCFDAVGWAAGRASGL